MSYPFVMPGVVYTGINAVDNLPGELRRMNVKKALLVTDDGIVNAGLHNRILELLNAEAMKTEIYSDVEAEPSTDCVDRAAEVARLGDYDVIIGLGGGSVIDVAKASSVLARNTGRIKDYMGVEKIPGPGIPTVIIPTTAGTGAEVTMNAIFAISDEKVKKGVVSRYLMPAVAIVDPVMTVTSPPAVTAATGIDALVHAVESYTSLKASPHTDIYAEEAIKRISRSIRRAVTCGTDMEARSDMSLGSFFAGVSLANAGVGAVHALAYPLGGQFHVSHGVANAVLFAAVLKYNLVGHLFKFARVAQLMGEPVDGRSPRRAALLAVKAVRELIRDVGIPSGMRELGVSEGDIETLAEGASDQVRLLANNPRPMTKDDIAKIYSEAL